MPKCSRTKVNSRAVSRTVNLGKSNGVGLCSSCVELCGVVPSSEYNSTLFFTIDLGPVVP